METCTTGLTPQQRYNAKNRLQINERSRNSNATNLKKRISFYAWNAKRRGMEFSIGDSISTLMKRPCVYCGAMANPFNGIDRMDNSLGYSEANSVSCCKQCNWGKGNMFSAEGYIEHCLAVARLWYTKTVESKE
jgi:hypothetical protein